MTTRTCGLVVALAAGLAVGFGFSAETIAQQAPPASAAAASLSPSASDSGTGLSAKAQQAFVKQYCVTCHNDQQMTAGLSLEKFDPAHVDPSVAGIMVGKLKAKAMP